MTFIIWCITTSIGIILLILAMLYGWGLTPKSWPVILFCYAMMNVSHLVIWRLAVSLVNRWSKDKPWPPKAKKPPIGLRPKKFSDEQRFEEVEAAIWRYFNAGHKIPPEWIEEYNELLKVLE